MSFSYGGIVDIAYVEIFFIFVLYVGIDADDGIDSFVDTCLTLCGRFFDFEFGNSCFDSFCHAAHAFDFVNDFACVLTKFLGEVFDIEASPEGVFDGGDGCFVAQDELCISGDVCGEV